MLSGRRFDLKTLDVSLTGSLVEFVEHPHIVQGTGLDIRLDIGFVAKARVCRISRTVQGNLTAGLVFDRLDFSREA